eukprot:TRINITY_DN7199_c0_g1_i1.p1 TRINITY_DN7199_c0_g1~~TRINITY_DN7199_c0_g1_i1.p1  ORF type:complete len:540 (+),score=85.59 TRINITY_DN7199_c0_g1_i1:42-1661(+)
MRSSKFLVSFRTPRGAAFSTGGSARPATALTAADFNDTKAAYRVHSTWQLIRSLIVLRLCSVSWLVRNANTAFATAQRVLGNSLVRAVVRPTFFDQFCAGEDEATMQPMANHLLANRIGLILNPAMEADVDSNEDTATREGICNKNLSIVMASLAATGRAAGRPLVAFKLTGLGHPRQLERLTTLLLALRSEILTAASAATGACAPLHAGASLSFETFTLTLKRLDFSATELEARELFRIFGGESSEDKTIPADFTPHFDVANAVCETGTGAVHELARHLAKRANIGLMDAASCAGLKQLLDRMLALSAEAEKLKVQMLMDAEPTYLQAAIDHIVLAMQRKHNRSTPVVFNTYQCYLKASKGILERDLAFARAEGWIMAAKLVRGAYMLSERELATKRGLPSPVHDTVEDTHANFDSCVELAITRQPNTAVLIGTHNQRSIELSTQLMQRLGIPSSSVTEGDHWRVSFGQLYGMAHHLTYTLAQKNHAVYKYVIYGPLEEAVPYMGRRAQENGDVVSAATHERALLRKEVKRRTIPFGQ